MKFSRRVKAWLLVLGIADAVSWALTVDAHLTFHRSRGGPTVMPVGQLLGWSISILLLITILLVIWGARVDAKYRESNAPRYRR